MKSRFCPLLGTLVVSGLTQTAGAVDATWTGLGADSAWTTVGNWSVSPVPGVGNTATFDSGGNGKTTIITAPAALTSYIFNTGSAAYTISGATTTWTVPNGGGVTINSGVTTHQDLSGIQYIRPASGSTTNFSNQATNTTLKLGTIFNSNTSNGNALLKFTPTSGATIEIASGKTVDNAVTAGRTVSILLDDAGILKIAGTGSFSGTDADGNSVTIRQGTLMANIINIIGTARTSLGAAGRIQFGQAGQTRTATLDYYNAANTTTDRGFYIIDNNTAVFKVSGSAATNLGITTAITQSAATNGGGKLTKDGVGILTLGASNSYSSQTLISAGKLVVGHANALGTAGSFNSRTTINTGGTLEIATDTSVASEFLDITSSNSGAVVVNRATAGAGITQSTGTTYLGSGSTMNVTKGANVTSGNATLGIASVILAGGANATATLNSDTAAISVTGSVSSGVVFNKTLALIGAHSASEISGIISDGSGNVAVSKSGSGTWTLTNNSNSYTGATTVESGKLVINGNISTSTTSVKNTGTLGGSGTVGGVTVETGGKFAPGNSPGTMTFTGDLTLGLNSISDFEINAFTPGNYDLALAQVAGTQSVNFNSGILNLLFQSGFNTHGSVKIFNFDSYTGLGFNTVNVSGLADGFSATFNSTNGIVTVVPEPGAAMLVGGLGMLALRRRRA